MSTVFMALVLSSVTKRGSREFRSHTTFGQCHVTKAMRTERPLEELYHVQVERKLAELGISRWPTGKFKLPWDWHVDQLVYIEEGEVRVVPEGSEHFMTWFVPLNGSRIISSEDHLQKLSTFKSSPLASQEPVSFPSFLTVL